MAKIYRLEEFGGGYGAPNVSSHEILDKPQVSTEISGSNLSGPAFENGYRAGWEDAAQAANDEKEKFNAEFAHNLQDIGFTFHEARSHVVGSMESLLMALVDTLLPEVMADTIGARIIQEIMPLAEAVADRPIQIVVSPSNLPFVEPLLAQKVGCPLELVEESSLGVGQVFLRSGDLEREIDLKDAIAQVKQSFEALAENNKKVFANG